MTFAVFDISSQIWTPLALVAIGLELAADAIRRIGFEVPDVDGRRAAGQPDHDDVGRFPSLRFVACLQAKQIGQTEAEETGGADTEKVAAMETLAVGAECSWHD